MVRVNGRHECPACKKSYANRQYLSRHKKDCSRNSNVSYSCSKCTNVFSRKDSFNRHFPGCKGKEVSKVCSKCSVAFPTLWRLNRHIEQAHSTKDLKCKCDKIYQRRPAYEQHMKILPPSAKITSLHTSNGNAHLQSMLFAKPSLTCGKHLKMTWLQKMMVSLM